MTIPMQSLLQMSIEVRQRRKQLKAEVKSGKVKVSELLTEPTLPAYLQNMPAAELLAAVRQQSFKSACGLLAELGIPELKPLGKTTYRQRRVIADHVAARWEREAKKSGVTVRPHSPIGRGSRVFHKRTEP